MQWNEFSGSIRHLSVRDRNRVKQAFELGSKVHDGQLRKSGEPFFSHPVSVAEILTRWGADGDTVIAALLHDSVEDTPLTVEEVSGLFGPAVAMLIEGVTKLSSEEFAHRATLDEATETLRKMFRLMESDVRIIVIKLADRLHNMTTIEFLKPERQQAIAQETLDIYVKVAEQLSMQDLRHQLEELSLKTLDVPLYERLSDIREENEIKGEEVIEVLSDTLQKSQFSSPSIQLRYEHKSWQMLKDQHGNGNAPATGVPSLIVAIICKSVPDCYYMLGTLHQIWQREALSFQDYINSPLLNGYRGLHTTIIMGDGMRVRCKIRTEEMHRYTKEGITMFCFDSKAHGLRQYIPWAERISPLVEDTKNQSSEFWKSLQSDILGESIMIHGPEAKSMMLPKGSTALDGAFYFLGRDALSLEGIVVNGNSTSFKAVLQHGDTVTPKRSEAQTVGREWLPWVHTGVATALIRSALGEQSEEEKLSIGRHLFQEILTEKKKGFLEEFNEQMLISRVRALGYESLRGALMAIGEGHLKASELYKNLFEHGPDTSRRRCVIGCRFPSRDTAMIAALVQICERYNGLLQGVDIRIPKEDQSGQLSAKLQLNATELSALLQDFEKAGATEITNSAVSTRIQSVLGIVTIIGLWGLDPLIAKLILDEGMPPIVFTFIRAWAVVLFAFCVLSASQRVQRFSRIPLQHPALWASGIALFLVSLSTYKALSETSPGIYNTVMRGTAILLLTLPLLTKGHYARVGIAWAATLGGVAALSFLPMFSFDALSLCIGALILFALYTAASTQFQQTARIYARFQQFFFYSTTIAAVSSLTLIPFFPERSPEPWLVALTAAFSVVFVGIPYMLFYHLMPNVQYSLLSRAINASLLITFAGQALLYGTASMHYLLLAGTLFIIGNIVVSGSRDGK